jgi:hypothetical protein
MQDMLFETPEQKEPAAKEKKEEKQDTVPRPMVEAALGMSRKWDARQAGREVAETAIRQLKGPPSFFLLFSTIHYEKYGGFQELLNGVWDVLPKGTPLIGGTVRGFMNNYGCYTRGVTTLVVSSLDMDVAIGYGKNTKRNPKKAARQCASMIKEGLKNSVYKNKFLLNLISASEIPDISTFGRKKIIKPGLAPKALMQLFGFSQYVLQKGAGRDDEVIEELITHLPDFRMLGGGTIDNGPGFTSYQFINNNVLKNSIVSLGIQTPLGLDVLTTHNMRKTGIEFKITKMSKDGRIIHEINNKPAFSELLRLLNWSKDFLTEETWLKTTFYFPLGGQYNDSSTCFGPRIIGVVLGESLVTGFRSKDPNASILTIDGRRLLETIDKNLSSYQNKPEFGLIASCTTRLETMGAKISKERDRILQYFNESPFIVFYVGGESTYSLEKGLNYINMSFNSAIFWKEGKN